MIFRFPIRAVRNMTTNRYFAKFWYSNVLIMQSHSVSQVNCFADILLVTAPRCVCGGGVGVVLRFFYIHIGLADFFGFKILNFNIFLFYFILFYLFIIFFFWGGGRLENMTIFGGWRFWGIFLGGHF